MYGDGEEGKARTANCSNPSNPKDGHEIDFEVSRFYHLFEMDRTKVVTCTTGEEKAMPHNYKSALMKGIIALNCSTLWALYELT